MTPNTNHFNGVLKPLAERPPVCVPIRMYSRQLQQGRGTYMGIFVSVIGDSPQVCVCVYACMLGYADAVVTVSSRILEVLTFNLSRVRAITFSFVLMTVCKAIGYFIQLSAVLYKGFMVSLCEFQSKLYLITPDFQAVRRINTFSQLQSQFFSTCHTVCVCVCVVHKA